MHSSEKLPDPAICKTRQKLPDRWECLVNYAEHSWRCYYLLQYRLLYCCTHPDCRSFEQKDAGETAGGAAPNMPPD